MTQTTVKRPLGLAIIAILMILFGLAEVVTGFTHTFFGINTSAANFFTYSAAAIGLAYAVAGVLVLSMQRRAAAIAIVLLIIDVIGRVVLVIAGFYPTDTLRNTAAVIIGTVIVILFAAYIGWRRAAFH